MIETPRLLLRPWEERDRAPYHRIKSDPRVMATLGPLQSRVESDATIDHLRAREVEWGYSFWPVERRSDDMLIGYCGLVHPPVGTPIADELEIGWGLGSQFWGQGYATEAAAAVLAWAWANTARERVVATTSLDNNASRALMARLGMTRLPDGDFDHPVLTEGDPLRPHVSYGIERS